MAGRLHARAALTAGLVAIAVVVWLGPRVRSAWHPTDFDREMARIDADLAALGPNGLETPETATRLAFRLYHRATLTAQSADFAPIETLVDKALREWPIADLRLLRATIDLRFHRLDAARRDVNAVGDVANDDTGQLLLADIAMQEGTYPEARRRLDVVLARNPTWDARSRLAWLLAREGDVEGADRQYADAEADLTAKEMRACAWVELQWGQMYFARGQYDRAHAHYARARRAYSGYWLVDEYEAELLGARREFTEAIARYTDAIAKAPRPDLLQQLGDLYLAMGRPADANRWHDRALAGYLASANNGEVQFFHHLATFYSDVRQDGAEAVRWARRDFELRPSDVAADALAWAQYRNGQLSTALDASARALAGNGVDAHMLFHAATINEAAGRAADARRFRERLQAFNPRYADFHVHR
jgi:tetratricopeptide (TPR) repeat protein